MSAPIQSHGSPIVSPSELIRLIVHCYKRRIPLMIWGIPGIGKSSCFRQAGRILAEELGKKYGEYPWMQPSEDHFLIHDLRMTLRNPVDIRGTPWPNRVKEVTEWLPTEELPKTGYGIILFDDIPTAEPSCQKAAFRLFLQRSLDNYILPDGYWVAAAGNRFEHAAGAFRIVTPLRTRWVNVELRTTTEDFLNWGIKNDIDGRILAFIRARPDMLCKFDPKAKQDTYPLPRTWEFASTLIKRIPSENTDEILLYVSSAVTVGAAVEFSAFLKLALDYDWESLLKEPNTFPLPTSIDQLYALSGILMEKVNDEQLLRPTLIILKRIFGTAPEFGALVGKYIVERYSTKLLEYPEWKPIQKWGKFLL